MRTLEEIAASAECLHDTRGLQFAAAELVREAHALGRSEGFAEGVEAAARACQAEDPDRSSHIGRATLNRAEGRIRALRAPSHATGADARENATWDTEAAKRGLPACEVDVGEGYCCVRRRGHPSPHWRILGPSPREDAAMTLRRLGGTPPSPEAQQANLDANIAALDAPRCGSCGRDWWTPDSRCPDCGTGRSTTGGGR